MWPVKEVDESAVAGLAAAASVSGLTARLLWLRGVRDADAVRTWLAPDVRHFHPPELLPDFAAAVARIRRAIAERETILVWGHDDLDGVTSVVVLYRLLSDLRAKVSYYIPEKGRERHGLNADVVNGHLDRGVRLVVTVDCGITNRQQVESLHAKGVDVVITDHHEVTEELPGAVACVDPKRPDSEYPYRGLAGVGVALKLAMGVAREALGVSPTEFLSVQPQLFALTVLGTLADRVPLTGENRTLVALGLRRLETCAIPAVRAVVEYLNATEKLTVHRFVTELLPLFAAANGNEGAARFLSAAPVEAQEWVGELAGRREEWRAESDRTFELAMQNLSPGDGIVFARSQEFSLRTLGQCAARLKDRFHLPAIVMGWRGDAWVGEGRGVEGLNLMDLLSACNRYFMDYGGHRKAAGFSMQDEQVADFLRCAEAYAHENFAGRAIPDSVLAADAALPVAEFETQLAGLAPFGEGNPQPLFVSGPTRLVPGSHGWSVAERPELLFRPARPDVQMDSRMEVDMLYTLDDFGRLTILDVKPVEDRPQTPNSRP
jgi:single-stranded-DNA-specific exonuclease